MNTPVVLDPQALKAFDAVADLVKQLIALSTGVIALTITFLSTVVNSAPANASRYLKMAWVLYCLNVLFGVMAMMAIAGTLGSDSATKNIYQPNISVWVGLQVFAFMCGTGLVIAFGAASLNGRNFSGVGQRTESPVAAPDNATKTSEPAGKVVDREQEAKPSPPP
jgi:hypothetical protein